VIKKWKELSAIEVAKASNAKEARAAYYASYSHKGDFGLETCEIRKAALEKWVTYGFSTPEEARAAYGELSYDDPKKQIVWDKWVALFLERVKNSTTQAEAQNDYASAPCNFSIDCNGGNARLASMNKWEQLYEKELTEATTPEQIKAAYDASPREYGGKDLKKAVLRMAELIK
jgi:hypothetical protein